MGITKGLLSRIVREYDREKRIGIVPEKLKLYYLIFLSRFHPYPDCQFLSAYTLCGDIYHYNVTEVEISGNSSVGVLMAELLKTFS